MEASHAVINGHVVEYLVLLALFSICRLHCACLTVNFILTCKITKSLTFQLCSIKDSCMLNCNLQTCKVIKNCNNLVASRLNFLHACPQLNFLT